LNKSGTSWDVSGGAADPYVIGYSSLGAASHTGQTSVIEDTHSPAWNEPALTGISAAELLSNLSFEIWDHDDAGSDLIGGCTIPVTEASFDGFLHIQDCPATASTVAVKLYYRFQQP
jgi:Ca2+-dependent lipid-binding protein